MIRQFNADTVFMLAPQRHGSNKSQSLLSGNHPDLFGPYPPIPRTAFVELENKLADNLLSEIVLNANLSPRSVCENQHEITAAETHAELTARNLPVNTFGIMTSIYHIGARHSGQQNTRILCKSPDNLDVAEQYAHEINDAIFVHIIRDPRAVWNSGRGTPRGDQTPHKAALKWENYHLRAKKLADKFPVITIKYEDLMKETEAQLKRFCEFLQIDFFPEMMHGHHSQDAKDAAKVNPGLWGNLDKPVLQERADAWRKELPERDIYVIENTCRSTMATFGYQCESQANELTQEDMELAPDVMSKAPVEEPRKHQLIHLNHIKRKLHSNSE
ncbi:MAG: sulfotransferase [Fuerstiella sp.]|nr:sulfotransferase [Fuerstiella sp.]